MKITKMDWNFTTGTPIGDEWYRVEHKCEEYRVMCDRDGHVTKAYRYATVHAKHGNHLRQLQARLSDLVEIENAIMEYRQQSGQT